MTDESMDADENPEVEDTGIDDAAGAMDRDDPEVEARDAQASPPPPPPTRRPFVRDPYARFGGVASGLAHYFGWDVALTRLGVALLFVVSGGTAILAYLLAWLIVPRARYWPPSGGPTASSRLSSRELGVGLAVLGALLALAIAGGRPGAVLIPLALIGGGLWLLSQDAAGVAPPGSPSAAPPPTPPMAPPVDPASEDGRAPEPGPVAAATITATAVAPPAGPPRDPVAPISQDPGPPPPYDPGPPVPPRSRRRRWILRSIIGLFVLFVVALVAIPVTLFLLARSGNLDFDPDQRVLLRPATIVELPERIVEDTAEVVLDLRDLDADDFDGADTPVEVEVDLDVGEIRVRVPEDLRVTVDASSGIGDVEVFGSRSDGFFPDHRLDVGDAHVELELEVGIGEITVERG